MKKITFVIIAAIITVSMFALPSSAADSPIFVAFGDSISYGYGLTAPETEGCVYIAAKELNCDIYNYAVNGMTSEGLIDLLENLDSTQLDNLFSASVISVTIGSNNLLTVLNKLNRDIISAIASANLNDIFQLIYNTLTSEELQIGFEDGIKQLENDLPVIYNKLKDANPGAQIIIAEIYNPYYGVKYEDYDFSAICDVYISKMNDVIHDGAKTMDYSVAKIYEAFNEVGYTFVDLSNFNFDPHPNVAGHSLYADMLLEVIDTDKIIKPAVATVFTDEPATESSPDTSDLTGKSTDILVFWNSYKVLIIVTAAMILIAGGAAVVTKKKNRK